MQNLSLVYRDGDDHSSKRQRLWEIINERSFSDDEERTLSSGRKSWLYFNTKTTMMYPEGGYLLAELVLDELQKLDVDYVGGLEMGAVPPVSQITLVSHLRDGPKSYGFFFIRKEAKNHGTRQLIEGLTSAETLKDKSVVLVDDVTTTGGSVISAIKQVRKEGAQVNTVITLVDRQEGAAENLHEEGVELIPLFTADEFSKKK